MQLGLVLLTCDLLGKTSSSSSRITTLRQAILMILKYILSAADEYTSGSDLMLVYRSYLN